MEHNMSDDNQKQQKELSPEELDKVGGGFASIEHGAGKGNTASGGQNDPAQQFQQILQQLTQGQG
jgi:6-phosphogluconate dehydrogenase